ncbi:MAG TPA: hypothetical protein VFO15_18070 [Xanthobacteraceae bacterium]|nr:hypothetical protein [Xanthobacteraceae bacterium]
MTQTDPTTLACPSCGNTITAPLDAGRRLCINCRHEWNPNDAPRLRAVPTQPSGVPAPPPVVPTRPASDTEPPGATHEAEAAADDTEGTDGPEWDATPLEALVGTLVVLEGGQVATLVSFPDDDHAEVVIGAGTDAERLEVVSLNDVERSIDAPPPVADVPTETAVALAAVNMTVAGLVLQAGLASIAGEYPNAELLTPPTGWLPLDVDGLPALEQGCAYAVAFLVHAYSLNRDDVAGIAAMLLNASQETNTMKGGTDHDQLANDRERAASSGAATDNAGERADTGTELHGGGDSADPS